MEGQGGDIKNYKRNLGDFKDRFISMESKMEILWKNEVAPSNSPRQLNERGNNILENSGIKNLVNKKKDKLLELVRAKNATNPYDAERAIEEIMNGLPSHCPDIINELKTGAFNTGVDIGSVLFVGAIYLRNLIFKDLGFSLEDLDKQNNKK